MICAFGHGLVEASDPADVSTYPYKQIPILSTLSASELPIGGPWKESVLPLRITFQIKPQLVNFGSILTLNLIGELSKQSEDKGRIRMKRDSVSCKVGEESIAFFGCVLCICILNKMQHAQWI